MFWSAGCVTRKNVRETTDLSDGPSQFRSPDLAVIDLLVRSLDHEPHHGDEWSVGLSDGWVCYCLIRD